MYRMMLVEDEPPLLEMLRDMIGGGQYGIEVNLTAVNGKEALKKLSQAQELPDVLLTDIEMPLLGGMELIRQVNEQYPSVVCVILSGHSDFAYARTAIHLQVFDYLLKPITVGSLGELMRKLLAQLQRQQSASEQSYIQSALHTQALPKQIPAVFQRGQFYVVLLLAGHFCNQYFDAIGSGQHFWSELALSDIVSGITGSSVAHWVLDGKYPNERLLVLKTEQAGCFSAGDFCDQLLERLRNAPIPVNLIYSAGVDSLAGLPAVKKRLARILTNELIYARSRVYDADCKSVRTAVVTQALEQPLSVLAKQHNYKQYCDSLKALLKELSEKKCTQLELQTILQYFVLRMPLVNQAAAHIDISELLWESMSYACLYENLCSSIKNQFGQMRDGGKQLAAKDLVDRLEVYLIEHYNQNISSKDFFDLFGYNEIYLINVFRNSKGLSPNKFITNCRVQKAREFLDRDPSILIRVVAEMVGYDDPLYFSRVFKSIVGQSPSEYIKNADPSRGLV